MRVIHLCFQLHVPYELQMLKSDETDVGVEKGGHALAYFNSAESFRRTNHEVYQPFLALIERNVQKFKALHFSLIISGAWLEQAEQYEPELIERLKKLVKTGQVELVSVPYYHSLAFFYAQDELLEQVEKYQSQLERLFGVKGRIFALPELIYNDAIGKWAEEFGFAGMLVGGSARALDWRSPNHVYEAAGCKYLRLLVRNWHLSDLIERGDESLLVEKKGEDGEKKLVLSLEKFRKLLDLDFLRGSLVNLCFDTQMFAQRRQQGVTRFFDELFTTWLNEESNKFATAAEACVVETPTAELSIKNTVSWRGDAEGGGTSGAMMGVVLKSEVENKLPEWLNRRDQVEVSKLVYGARRQILASEDQKLANDLRRLMLVDYHKGTDSSVMAKITEIVEDLKRRTEEIKKSQAVEISRAYTKKRDRGEVERKTDATVDYDGAIRVNFDRQPGTVSGAVHVKTEDEEGLDIPVRRLGGQAQVVKEDLEDDTAEVVGELENEIAEEIPVVRKRKTHAVRKIIKKLVIE